MGSNSTDNWQGSHNTDNKQKIIQVMERPTGIFKKSMWAGNRVGLSYWPARAGTFKQSMGARNRVGIAISYRPARLLMLEELILWNRFLGS
jgi:hypothetical protein